MRVCNAGGGLLQVGDDMPVVDVMGKYGVFNHRQVKERGNLYTEQGPAAFGSE